MYKTDFEFKIVRHIAVLSERDETGMQMEFNIVSFNGKTPKWDIRKWDENHEKMSKGISMTNPEFENLMFAIDHFNDGADYSDNDDDEMSDTELLGNTSEYDSGLDPWTANGMD